MTTSFKPKWKAATLKEKQARLDEMRCRLAQPPESGCVARLNRERLEAKSSLLALEIARIECAQRSST